MNCLIGEIKLKSNNLFVLLAATSLLLSFSGFAQKKNADDKVKKILAQMSLEEKVGQMTQVTFDVVAADGGFGSLNPTDKTKLEKAILDYHVGSILNTPYGQAQTAETWRNIITSIQDVATKKSRLKIPVLYGIDAIHGATYTTGATLFPQALALASSFNRELAKTEGDITAKEIRASGIPWNFYPVLDIGRMPTWPRFWETYGEDSYVASELGSAYIRSHQGDDYSDPEKAITCLKHYMGYSMPLTGKDRTPAWIPERQLREIFLPSFQAGVEAGSPTAMINSGEINGIPGHANHHILSDILRDELKFKGFTVSDWEDIKRLYTRDKVAETPKEAVKMAVMAGVDMSMVPYDFTFYDLLVELVKTKEVPMSRIDEAVGRILKVKYEMGLFDNPYPDASLQKNFATKEHTQKNLEASHETIILAKNEGNILPLKKTDRILVTGPTANLLKVLNGGWTITWQGDREDLYPQEKSTLLEAIQGKSSSVTYVEGVAFDKVIDLEAVKKSAENADVILLCIGEPTYCETPGNIASLELDDVQKKLAEVVLATGKPVVTVVIEGRPRIITPIVEKSKGVIVSFLPGMEGGRALADVIFGDYNPDAKFPCTYPRSTNDFTTYDYKTFAVFDVNYFTPLFEFGSGLSYTEFEYSGLTLNKSEMKETDQLEVEVTITNKGKIAGKESVLMYLTDVVRSITPPNKQLKGFDKIYLNPGESKQVKFTLSSKDLSFIGLEDKRIVEKGEFKIHVKGMTKSFKLI